MEQVMQQLGEGLTRLGLLWLDGFVVMLVVAVQAGPFLLAGGGIGVLTWFLIERDRRRDRAPGSRRQTGEPRSEPQQPFTVR